VAIEPGNTLRRDTEGVVEVIAVILEQQRLLPVFRHDALQRTDKLRAVGARVGQGGRVVEENVQIAVGNRLGQQIRGLQVQTHGAEAELWAVTGLFGDVASQCLVIRGVAEQDLRRVDADKGRVVFEVVKEMRNGALLIHVVLPDKTRKS